MTQTSRSTQPSLHPQFFCFRDGQSHASASLRSGWVDAVTGLERQGYTVSLFCHLPPLALTGPNTCIQAPTAQPINHCLLIQYKRKFAQGARLRHYHCLVPIYFWSSPFQSLGVCLTWKDRYASGSNCYKNCDVLRCINGLDNNPTHLDLCVCSFCGITFIDARSRLGGMCPHNYSHYALTHSLFTVTLCHLTLRGKWHFIFYLQTISGEALRLMHVPLGTCVLLKEPPINLWALPINANRPHIIGSLNQPHNICSDKLTELQNDLTSFYIAMYPWLNYETMGLNCLCGHFTRLCGCFASFCGHFYLC